MLSNYEHIEIAQFGQDMGANVMVSFGAIWL